MIKSHIPPDKKDTHTQIRKRSQKTRTEKLNEQPLHKQVVIPLPYLKTAAVRIFTCFLL